VLGAAVVAVVVGTGVVLAGAKGDPHGEVAGQSTVAVAGLGPAQLQSGSKRPLQSMHCTARSSFSSPKPQHRLLQSGVLHAGATQEPTLAGSVVETGVVGTGVKGGVVAMDMVDVVDVVDVVVVSLHAGVAGQITRCVLGLTPGQRVSGRNLPLLSLHCTSRSSVSSRMPHSRCEQSTVYFHSE